jgi:hypothetical protein
MRQALRAFDGSKQRQLAAVCSRFAYCLDDSVTFWWMPGMRFGVVGNAASFRTPVRACRPVLTISAAAACQVLDLLDR